ncbi:hypothetical protein CRN84_14730 [Budvicia aquatica]|uniref:Uncharacterized protein n=1 Tax=Budvicia aquatica TaxID=82979 RepID=A0A2C6DNX6_9GAMM|nr:hypothetical protein CRN84_14730 [Budvicia aquatica]
MLILLETIFIIWWTQRSYSVFDLTLRANADTLLSRFGLPQPGHYSGWYRSWKCAPVSYPSAEQQPASSTVLQHHLDDSRFYPDHSINFLGGDAPCYQCAQILVYSSVGIHIAISVPVFKFIKYNFLFI